MYLQKYFFIRKNKKFWKIFHIIPHLRLLCCTLHLHCKSLSVEYQTTTLNMKSPDLVLQSHVCILASLDCKNLNVNHLMLALDGEWATSFLLDAPASIDTSVAPMWDRRFESW